MSSSLSLSMNKGSVKVDDGAENRHCHTTYNNGLHIVAEQTMRIGASAVLAGCFRTTKIRLENISGAVTPQSSMAISVPMISTRTKLTRVSPMVMPI